jgi:hypothetical protein
MGLFDKLIEKQGGAITKAPPVPDVEDFIVKLDSDPHFFYTTEAGCTLYLQKVKQGTVLQVGPRIPILCLFKAHWLLLDGQKVGYVFDSEFQVSNKGGYIMAYLEKGVGKAATVEVLVKTDTLVIYSFPNRGTLIVSPHIGEDMKSVLDEQ